MDGEERPIDSFGHISDFMGADPNFHYPKDEDDTPEMITESVKKDVVDFKFMIPYS